jgi:hypothetical protein
MSAADLIFHVAGELVKVEWPMPSTAAVDTSDTMTFLCNSMRGFIHRLPFTYALHII